MEREILFRAIHIDYDGNFKEFSYWGINYPKKGVNSFPATINGTKIKCHEQYTGLKDKNGKKIFEGDRIEDDTGMVGIVMYHEDSFYIDSEVKEWWVLRMRFKDCEIIGNIHEENNGK